MKTVSFYLPGPPRFPSGGYKVVFEYANSLCLYGYQVNILYDCRSSLRRFHLPYFLRKIIAQFLCKQRPKWFVLNPNIRKYCIMCPEQDVPKADFIFATAYETANSVCTMDSMKGKKFYFIQGYENWDGTTEVQLKKTYQMGMCNIVISKWLMNIVEQCSHKPAIYISNFIDTAIFDIDISPEKRMPYSISMLCAKGEEKGTKYGLMALKQLKKIYPQLKVSLFGTIDRPEDVAPWMTYTKSATEHQLRKIYNQSAIYLCPSVREGWGLTGMESMACGCAYVASDYGGVHEYAVDGRTVLLSFPKDVNGMMRNIEILMKNHSKRISMAWQGYEEVRANFSKDESVKKLLSILK